MQKGTKSLHLLWSSWNLPSFQTSVFIARMLSGLDPSDLMGREQEDLIDFIANCLEQKESPEGTLP